jgi:S1-C subfamily serine protease
VYGVRVVAVAPQGPAEKAALALGSDIIVAVDGRPTETPEALGAAIAAHTPSDTVHLLVFGNHSAPGVASGNVYRDVAVELRAAP